MSLIKQSVDSALDNSSEDHCICAESMNPTVLSCNCIAFKTFPVAKIGNKLDKIWCIFYYCTFTPLYPATTSCTVTMRPVANERSAAS